VRLALALCVLLLVAPAAALADYPVISYVDENGVFRLYEAEFAREVDPPPPVPANFPGFRYAISLNGRYVVFTDAQKQLHLLDRATTTQLPLPGIDVYIANGPGSLTVSNGGRIAFDDNGNGPARVYESATGQFLDTGLTSGHRQPRLSGDGLFLATTCDLDCVDGLDPPGVDAYVQDLATRLDTGFPSDAVLDEEHPCVDADGSLVGFDRPSALLQPFDVYVYDRGASQQLTLPGLNDPAKDETHCVLDAAGAYVGLTYDQSGTASFRAYQVASQTFLSLPADKEFDSRSMFSAAYTPPAPPQPGGGVPAPAPAPSGDRTKPVVSRFRMSVRRFPVRRRATSFRFGLSEPAEVRVVIRRLGRYVGTIRRRGLAAGANRIPFGGRVRGRRLRPGPYVAVVIARDVAGNLSLPRLTNFRVLRPEGDGGP
jgi:hypothetical protein